MPDREKVIKEAEEAIDILAKAEEPTFCLDFVRCAFENALALLKERKADGKWIYGEDETGVDGWHCSECNFFEPWFYEFTDDIDFIRYYGFCPSCGRKMTSYTGKPTQER